MNRLAPIQSTAGFHLSGRPIVFQPPIKVRKKKSAFKTKAGKSGKIMFDTSKARYHRQRAGIGRPTRNLQRRSNDIGRDFVGPQGLRRPQQQNPIIILQEQQREAELDLGVRRLEVKERKQKIKLERTPLIRRVKQEKEAYRQMRDKQQEASFLAQGLSPIGLPIGQGIFEEIDEDDPEVSRGEKVRIKQEAFARGGEAFRREEEARAMEKELAEVLAELGDSDEEVVSVKPSVKHARAQRRERRQERRKALIDEREVDVPLLRTPEDPLRERRGGLRDVPVVSYAESDPESPEDPDWVEGEGDD